MLTALVHLLTPIMWIGFGAVLGVVLVTRRLTADRCPDCGDWFTDVPDTTGNEPVDSAVPASAETDHGP